MPSRRPGPRLPYTCEEPMDITRVLALVRPFFGERGEPYAIVGGLALLAYGAARATFDVDLLAPRATRGDFVAYLEARGFATLSVQAGFSNHQHSETALGRLDVIYVSGTTAEAVFAGCTDRAIGPGSRSRSRGRSTSSP